MTPRGTTGETAGTSSVNHLADRPSCTMWRPQHADWGMRPVCVCGREYAPTHVPAARKAER